MIADCLVHSSQVGIGQAKVSLKQRIEAGDEIDPVAPATADTPLTMAIRHRDLEMVDLLIGAGADVDHRGYSTPLAFALPDLRLMKRLLDAGAKIHRRGLDAQTAFSRAVLRAGKPTSSGDSLLLVRCLLEAGAHPSADDRIAGELLMELERGEARELFHELLPHYLEEVAGAHLRELQISFRDRERGDGRYPRGGELKFAAGREDVAYRSQRALPGRAALGDLARVRELLAAVTSTLGSGSTAVRAPSTQPPRRATRRRTRCSSPRGPEQCSERPTRSSTSGLRGDPAMPGEDLEELAICLGLTEFLGVE